MVTSDGEQPDVWEEVDALLDELENHIRSARDRSRAARERQLELLRQRSEKDTR